jgi:hypothetical protein
MFQVPSEKRFLFVALGQGEQKYTKEFLFRDSNFFNYAQVFNGHNVY